MSAHPFVEAFSFKDLPVHPDPPDAAEFEARAAAIKEQHMEDVRKGVIGPKASAHPKWKPPSDLKRRPPRMVHRIFEECIRLANGLGVVDGDALIAALGKDPNDPFDRNNVVSMLRYLRKSGSFPYSVLCRKPGNRRDKPRKCEVPSGPRRSGKPTAPQVD